MIEDTEGIIKTAEELCDKLSHHFLCAHCPLSDYDEDGGEICLLDRIPGFFQDDEK